MKLRIIYYALFIYLSGIFHEFNPSSQSFCQENFFRNVPKLPEPLKCSQAFGPVVIITVISQSQQHEASKYVL